MSHFLFIDGEYLREAHRATMDTLYGEVPPIEHQHIIGQFGEPRRVYYYDSVDRNSVGSENADQTASRVSRRDEFHAYLNSLAKWHVREGFVSRGRRASRRSQKGVDVQLAVDALEHAVARNITRASFIFGDLDFEPLLFSLNRFGVETHVWYERGTASADLLEAADVRHQMTVRTFYELASTAFRERSPSPEISQGASQPSYPILKKGTWFGRSVQYGTTNTRDFANIWVAPGTDPVREPSLTVRLSQVGDNGEHKIRQLLTMTHGGEIVGWRDGHLS